MSCSFIRAAHLLGRRAVSVVGEADVERLIDVQQMPEDIPGCLEETGFVLQNANGAVFCERTEERAAAWSAIEPDDQRNSGAGLVHIVSHRSEQLIVHATGALLSIPIDLLISFVEESVPAKDWNMS